jgi:antitoxin VapB
MGVRMKTAKVFKCGNSQAIRLPKEFQFHCNEVEIIRKGNSIILREKPKNLKRAFEILASLSDDFFADGREDLPPQERDFF